MKGSLHIPKFGKLCLTNGRDYVITQLRIVRFR